MLLALGRWRPGSVSTILLLYNIQIMYNIQNIYKIYKYTKIYYKIYLNIFTSFYFKNQCPPSTASVKVPFQGKRYGNKYYFKRVFMIMGDKSRLLMFVLNLWSPHPPPPHPHPRRQSKFPPGENIYI